MMRINWFATTAFAALVGSGAAWAQAPQQHHEQKAAAQAQQEHGKPSGAQSAQHEDRGEKKEPSVAQRHEGDSNAKGHEESSHHAQANEPQQGDKKQGSGSAQHNAQGEKASHGAAEQKHASETKKNSKQHNAREESKGQDKAKSEAKANEQNPSGQAQDTTQSKSRNTAQAKQSDKKNGKQNQASTSSSQSKNPSTAANTDKKGNTDAAQNNDPSRQNNASTSSTNTASANLNESDRTKVFSRLKQDKTTTHQNVNIQVSLGERLPARVHPHRLPADIVTIMPEYRGYDYVMVNDEIAIVRPGTRKVVKVIREGGPSYASTETRGSRHISLSTEQRHTLLREAKSMTSSQVSSNGSSCLSLQPVPQSIVSQNPDLRGLQLLKIGDEAVLVDPKDHQIVDVIRQ